VVLKKSSIGKFNHRMSSLRQKKATHKTALILLGLTLLLLATFTVAKTYTISINEEGTVTVSDETGSDVSSLWAYLKNFVAPTPTGFAVAGADGDGDLVDDLIDNCPPSSCTVAADCFNPGQENADGINARMLIYWPLDEGSGTFAHDVVIIQSRAGISNFSVDLGDISPFLTPVPPVYTTGISGTGHAH